MNVQAALRGPQRVAFRRDDFLLLRRTGAFAGFGKTELILGELFGVPLGEDGEPDSDASMPIKLRVEDYLALDRTGAFRDYAKTELVDGTIYEMSPQHRLHGYCRDELAYRLRRALEAMQSPLHVATEQSMAIPPDSEPQPDIVLTREPRGDGAIPLRSVALVAEVSTTSLRFDLEDKALVYAAAGVPEYWVVDVNAATIHQLWAPVDRGYTQRRGVAFGELLAAITVAELAVATSGLG